VVRMLEPLGIVLAGPVAANVLMHAQLVRWLGFLIAAEPWKPRHAGWDLARAAEVKAEWTADNDGA
jgi:hypothetical protein